MTNHWNDIQNADVILIMGSNTAENHPMAFKHIEIAKEKGAKVINVDCRFNRSSSKAHIHAFMRSGTDIAFILGMIRYAIENGLYNEKYVKECTNALFKVRTDFETCAEGTLGVFSGFSPGSTYSSLEATLDSSYSKTTWDYQYTVPSNVPILAADLSDSECVFQKLWKQVEPYTIDRVCDITGTDPGVYREICETYLGTWPDDKSGTILYAMGTTQHTVGAQNIRAYSILQMLLGNMGVAGGGINALRGQDNVQGATDQAVLHHILPGYLKVPTPAQISLSMYNSANYNSAHIIEPDTPYTIRGATGGNPTSLYWWQNGNKYITSLLKAWWPDENPETSYTWLSRKTADYSILSMFDAISKGEIKGAIFDGENPAVSDPNSEHVREGLAKLEWLVCIDPFETETAAFWKRPDVDPSAIDTVVYLLPAAVSIEKYGSRSNSSRLVQWHYKGGKCPGEDGLSDYGARPDIDILKDLGERIISKLKGTAGDRLSKLSWPCINYTSETGDAYAQLVALEMHGYNMSGASPTSLVNNFTDLKADGTTACGNWLHSGMFNRDVDGGVDSFEESKKAQIWSAGGTFTLFDKKVGNRAKSRYTVDVGNLGWYDPNMAKGLYSYWAWCWPINRRIVYNRASTYQSDKDSTHLAGDPLAPNKYVLKWDASINKWRGDVGDNAAAVGAYYPFIMLKEGHAHMFGGWTMAEGPFPWHYEPLESPIDYPNWLGSYRVNPCVHYYGNDYQFVPHDSTEYTIFATSYRLTEHWHTGSMSRNLPYLNELMPEPFVEMSEELAANPNNILGGTVATGDIVTVSNPRGSIDLKALVTKRFKPFVLNGEVKHQVGIVWHWGYMALSRGPSGNILTPYVGDANTRIPEYKCFRVKIQKKT